MQGRLLNSQIDLAFLLGPVSEPTIENLLLPSFELAWYKSSLNKASTKELLKKPVACYARDTKPYRELKEALFEHYGSTIRLYPSSSLSACFKLVEENVCIAALPIENAKDFVERESITQFTLQPPWVPNPLCFTASYIGEPKNYVVESVAHIALNVATAFKHDCL